MPVVFDATYLIPLLDARVKGSGDLDIRLTQLVAALERTRTRILVPSPALTEVLIGAGNAAANYLDIINRASAFRIAPFGERAAVEAAAELESAIAAGDKRAGSRADWKKVKFDRQIIAIARVEGARTIYSDDDDIRRYAGAGLTVIPQRDLPTASGDPRSPGEFAG